MHEPNLGGISFPVAMPAALPVTPIYPPPPSTIPRADAWRPPVPPEIQIVDTGGERPVVTGHIVVQAPHHEPGGYEGTPQVVEGPLAIPQPAGAAYEQIPAALGSMEAAREVAARAVAAKPETDVEFEFGLGGETETIVARFHDVQLQDDLLVFVGLEQDRLWLPKQRESGEIAARIGRTVYKLTVLPLQFAYSGFQFRLALVVDAREIPA
jgi:hypothetical protein